MENLSCFISALERLMVVLKGRIMEWMLIVFIFAGTYAKAADNVTLKNIAAFNSQLKCEEAGKAIKPLVVDGTSKGFRYVCLQK